MSDGWQFDHCDDECLREIVRRDLRGCAWMVVAAVELVLMVAAVAWRLR